MPDYRLRDFDLDRDYEAALALWSSSPGIGVGQSDTREGVARKLQRDPDLFLVAEAGGRLIGTVIGGWDGRRGIVYHLAVDADYWRQGIGRALMDELERRLRVRGCRRMWLMVHRDNSAAIQFYEAQGWETIPVQPMGKRLEVRD